MLSRIDWLNACVHTGFQGAFCADYHQHFFSFFFLHNWVTLYQQWEIKLQLFDLQCILEHVIIHDKDFCYLVKL